VNLVTEQEWGSARDVAIADSIACAANHSGAVKCGGEPGQRLDPIKAPVGLQAERLDLIERGLSFRQLECRGIADRNRTTGVVDLGEQYCCGIQHHNVMHCWGVLPPHTPRDAIETNASVSNIIARACVTRTRYLRDLGLMLLLDTHPNVSTAEATTNFTQPYLCYDVPRRWTFNITEHIATWLNINITNTSNYREVRSWQTTMLLTVQLAAYTDTLSCFNFSQPFPQLHCAAMLPYVNRTVPPAPPPPKPFTIRRMTVSDVFTTTFSLAHTIQTDGYCFEKLRLTAPEQFQRGAAWYRSRQRVAEGFEALFTFQIDSASQLCKTVRTLVTGIFVFERCVQAGSDGLAFVLRADAPAAAIGRGGGSLGYGGLRKALAIEIDTWHNDDMGDMFYNHVSVQTGGPDAPVGAHAEQLLASAALHPEVYPNGLADGRAHIVRVRYTPGIDDSLLRDVPAASPNHLRYWVQEGEVAAAAFPHTKSIATWARPGTGILSVHLDQMDTPLLAIPIDLSYTLGLEDGRAWTGFTAATGRRFQAHYVLAWQFCEGAAGCEQPLSACDAFGCNSEYPSARYQATAAGVEPGYVDLTTGVHTMPRPGPYESASSAQGRVPNGHVADNEEAAATETLGTAPPGFEVIHEPRMEPQMVTAQRFG